MLRTLQGAASPIKNSGLLLTIRSTLNAGATINSNPIDSNGYDECAFCAMVEYVSGSPSATIKLQESNDNVTFTDITSPSGSVPINSSFIAHGVWLFVNARDPDRKRYFRLAFVSSGTMVFNVAAHGLKINPNNGDFSRDTFSVDVN